MDFGFTLKPEHSIERTVALTKQAEAAGFSKVHDRLPEFMRYEKLAPHDRIFDVPDDALDAVYGKL